ncbi:MULTISPECIES: 2Fe-2S iron-sulfur cluster-binding protein [Pseudomonas]|jgi:succinate dehydrogenase/fumarate reductase-like Fe-S protein|uniref:(2Fe-2S)-binding protein n=1 Tax=Pseudomonas spelaei TaxID=1055469 RepID=A0A6I3W9C6_9PSED|nr:MULTISPECIES: 2Fe-2S iron-sulfur cluster-binding protein [Pseudomonas]MBT2374436.1 (2Fe-2S)-binding protein [Pseudomonas fluorescens]MUF06817.1 (2Fe-2S)-binding protein [Pseudomonas spelaei]
MIIYLERQPLTVRDGITVAAAVTVTRTSCTGQPRAAFCGMGICQECRMTIDGRRQLACQTLCREGMQVERSV